jgi:hypothetical protein
MKFDVKLSVPRLVLRHGSEPATPHGTMKPMLPGIVVIGPKDVARLYPSRPALPITAIPVKDSNAGGESTRPRSTRGKVGRLPIVTGMTEERISVGSLIVAVPIPWIVTVVVMGAAKAKPKTLTMLLVSPVPVSVTRAFVKVVPPIVPDAVDEI